MNKEEFEIKSKDLLQDVPEKYHNGCVSLAYELGHAYGYSEVYYYLQDIVERIFKV